MRALLTLLVFALDVWALSAVLDSRLSRRSTLAWTAIILFIPVLGVLLWWRAASTARTERPITP